ncbi:hypothetical protein GGH95_002385 [Coemansia sp. RSA 1836]|nr:hypothetical protein GGH95_002385 [Coemansia sp. RSA 1836]
MHVLLLANSKGYHWSWLKRIWPPPREKPVPADEHRALVFGACARSSVRIAGFPDTADPSPAHSVIPESLAAYIVKRTGGLVRMIEAIEAFWKLQVKFPGGLSAKSANSPAPATEAVSSSAVEIMDLALQLSGKLGPNATGKAAGYRRLYMEFLDHGRCTSVDCAEGHPVSRVVALGDVVQRFLSRKSKNRTSDIPVAAQKASFDPAQKASRAKEVRVTNTYPAELSSGAFPLIGRLVLWKRGVLYLQDATGWLQIRPMAVSIPSVDSDDSEPLRLEFTGQALVGHIYSWSQWRLTSESINIAPVGGGFSVPPGGSAAAAPFELVYVAAAIPTIIHADHSFGRGEAVRRIDASVAQCFLLLVHTQSPVTIASRSKKSKASSVSNDGGGGTGAWTSYIAVKGTGLKIGYSEFHSFIERGGNGEEDSALRISAHETKELLNCVVSYDPDQLPVSFMPGSAYVVCVDDPSTITRFSLSGTDIQVALKSACHVHPVWVTATDCSGVGGKSYEVVQHRKLLAQASGSGRHLHIPTIHIDSSSSKVLDAIRPPPVYPVRELHSLATSLLQIGPGVSEESRPGDIISVYGTIGKRGIKQVVTFTSSKSSAGDIRLGSKRSKSHSDSAGPRALCFDTRVVLRDSRDTGSTITLYIELSSFAHPLGLVPGTRVVVRDVRLEMARGSGRPYLRGVAATSFQEIATELAHDRQLLAEPSQATEDVEAERMCIGQLYGRRTRKASFNCNISAIEQLHISVKCKVCKQAVCELLCACAGRRHKLAAKPATVVVAIELQCRVADGSGIARLIVYGEILLAETLGLSTAEVNKLLAMAAQSSSGQLLWAPHQESQDAEASGIIARAAAACPAVALRVEGTLQREQSLLVGDQRQPLRVGGQSVLFRQQPTPRVTALQVTRLSTPALCWQLLADLDQRHK